MGNRFLSCFKANDVRGVVPDQLNPDTAYAIGRAFGQFLQARTACVGHDVRHSSPELAEAAVRGLMDAGADVHRLGLCGTEQVYFSVAHLGLEAGIMVTASHNPGQYNGMKFVGHQSRPVGGDTGLAQVRELAEAGAFVEPQRRGTALPDVAPDEYVEHLLDYLDPADLKPLKIVLDPGNGCAGPVVDLLEPHLPFELVKVRNEPDGDFPHGIPNPLLPENREYTARAVRESGAAFGVAWDGDFDRCFFFDEQGRFVEGYYLVALLARMFLDREPGGRIIHEPRLVWNTVEAVERAGGVPVLCRTGHAFIKQRMREEDAVYGGEMSGHHYFRDFAYCDSGMVPWLLVAQLLGRTGRSLSSFVDNAAMRYPVSGEINRSVEDKAGAIAAVRSAVEGDALSVDETDGVSMDFGDWRFNLRTSNTENLLRLNVETRGDASLLEDRTKRLLEIIDAHQG